MPYIDKAGRDYIRVQPPYAEDIYAWPPQGTSWNTPSNAGEVNYLFTQIIVDYIEARGLRYQNINDVLGAGLGALLEFYIRIVRPYEDLKIEENGDVYGPLLKLLEEAKNASAKRT